MILPLWYWIISAKTKHRLGVWSQLELSDEDFFSLKNADALNWMIIGAYLVQQNFDWEQNFDRMKLLIKTRESQG